MKNKQILIIGGGAAVVIFVAVLIWFLSPKQASEERGTIGNSFATGGNVSVSDNSGGGGETNIPTTSKGLIIFKIADGPVAGAVLIESGRPTTTVARYIMQESGHVLELPVDTPGAVPKAVSNTTIPGIVRVVWVERGNGLVAQYVDATTVKTVYLGFSATSTATSSTQKPTRIQFLPNNIADLAASPDGRSVAYLVRAGGGTDGYIARSDGSGGKKLFSFPLSQTLISWPSQNILLLKTKSGVAVPGGIFSVNTQTGSVTPLVYAEGLTASANTSFSTILYQTIPIDSSSPLTYAHDVKSGNDAPLSLGPFPEKCIWSSSATTTALCAAPIQNVASNFLDLWHQGAASASDAVLSFDISAGKSSIIAIPGSRDGGVSSDINEMSLSPTENYLSFISRGDRTLWGVRLTQ